MEVLLKSLQRQFAPACGRFRNKAKAHTATFTVAFCFLDRLFVRGLVEVNPPPIDVRSAALLDKSWISVDLLFEPVDGPPIKATVFVQLRRETPL